MTDLKARFAAYGGDYAGTMARFMGDEAFYLQMLQMLADDDCLARLHSALEANDLGVAFEAAHELKGVAGNLGLTPLFNAMCALVEPLRARQQQDYAPLYQAVAQAHRQAVALLPGQPG